MELITKYRAADTKSFFFLLKAQPVSVFVAHLMKLLQGILLFGIDLQFMQIIDDGDEKVLSRLNSYDDEFISWK